MTSPAIALARMPRFVAVKTQFLTRAPYSVNPAGAAVCPTKSHLDTPSLVPSRHCLRTWRASVRRRTAELAQPMRSVTP